MLSTKERKTSAELIREDLAPVLIRLFVIFGTSAMMSGPALAGRRAPSLPRNFTEYATQLYGHPGRDWFTALNYALLGAIIALIVTIVVLIS